MADLPSSPVADKPFVNEQLDPAITSPKQKQKLEADFGAFWDEQDKKSAASPAEPPEPETKSEPEADKQETPKTEGEEVKPEVSAEEEKKASAPADAPAAPAIVAPDESAKAEQPKTDDIESIELPSTAPEAQKSQFKQLKEIAKNFATEAKLYRAKLAPLLKEIGLELKDDPAEIGQTLDEFQSKVSTWKSGAMSPDIEKELETLREMSRVFNVLESPEFKKDYADPLNAAYFHVIEEMAKYFEGTKEEIDSNFLDPLKTKFKPSQLNPEWWDSQIELMKKAPASIRRKIEAEVANLMVMQDKHDARASELAKNKTSYAEWQNTLQTKANKAWEDEVRDETMKFVKDKHPEWEEDINKNTPRGQSLQKPFSEFVLSLSTPRGVARRGAEYVEMLEVVNHLKNTVAVREADLKAHLGEWEKIKTSLEADLKAATEKNSQLSDEVSKKRRISDAPLKPSAGTASPKAASDKPKLSEVGTRKGLDEAFAKHLPGA